MMADGIESRDAPVRSLGLSMSALYAPKGGNRRAV